MSSHSNARSRPRKPQSAKPHPDFPLTALYNRQGKGRWVKKIKGRLHYFGPIVPDDNGASAQAALDKWLAEKDDLLAGRVPRKRSENGVTLDELIGRFLDAKKALRDAGELSPHTWDDYHDTCEHLVKAFGSRRIITDLHPDDFAQLREKWSKRWGPVKLGNTVNKARVVFNFAYKTRLVPMPIFYGESFKRPSKKVMRLHRAEKGIRMFESHELRAMIDAAPQPLKAMLLLAINGGLGNNDLATMRMKHLDGLEKAWLTLPRQKTGLVRKIPLWPETVQAIREWLEQRPTPKDEKLAEVVFLTAWGGSLGKLGGDNPISKATARLMRQLKMPTGRNFYCCRHTFQTIGDDTRDFIAVRSLMGHASNDIADVYRERIDDDRLQAVCEHVRHWLFAEADAKPGKPALRLHAETGASCAGCSDDAGKEGVA